MCALGARSKTVFEALGRTAGFYDALLLCLRAPDDGSNGAYWVRLFSLPTLEVTQG